MRRSADGRPRSQLADGVIHHPRLRDRTLAVAKLASTANLGRDASLREGRRQLEVRRWQQPDELARSRQERLLLAAERLDDELSGQRCANQG